MIIERIIESSSGETQGGTPEPVQGLPPTSDNAVGRFERFEANAIDPNVPFAYYGCLY